MIRLVYVIGLLHRAHGALRREVASSESLAGSEAWAARVNQQRHWHPASLLQTGAWRSAAGTRWGCSQLGLAEADDDTAELQDLAKRLPALQDHSGEWPVLAKGTQRLGALVAPQARIVSLGRDQGRRQYMADAWRAADLDIPATWFQAVDGQSQALPDALVFAGHFDSRLIDAGQHAGPTEMPADPKERRALRGRFGCWLSHQAALDPQHPVLPTAPSGSGRAAAGPRGDLLVLEDDVALHPDFARKVQEFLAAVPTDWDLLHLGGDSFWAPPARVAAGFVEARGASRTWAYIVRGTSIEKVQRVMKRATDLRAVDTMLAEYAANCDPAVRIKTYVPPTPLVVGVSSLSGSETANPAHGPAGSKSAENETVHMKKDARSIAWTAKRWFYDFCGMTGDGLLEDHEWTRYCCTEERVWDQPKPLMCSKLEHDPVRDGFFPRASWAHHTSNHMLVDVAEFYNHD